MLITDKLNSDLAEAILNIFEIRSFNSLNLAMTVISSGGFLPSNNLSSILTNQTQIVILLILPICHLLLGLQRRRITYS